MIHERFDLVLSRRLHPKVLGLLNRSVDLICKLVHLKKRKSILANETSFFLYINHTLVKVNALTVLARTDILQASGCLIVFRIKARIIRIICWITINIYGCTVIISWNAYKNIYSNLLGKYSNLFHAHFLRPTLTIFVNCIPKFKRYDTAQILIVYESHIVLCILSGWKKWAFRCAYICAWFTIPEW